MYKTQFLIHYINKNKLIILYWYTKNDYVNSILYSSIRILHNIKDLELKCESFIF